MREARAHKSGRRGGVLAPAEIYLYRTLIRGQRDSPPKKDRIDTPSRHIDPAINYITICGL